MVARSGLDVPNITSVTAELTRFQGSRDRVLVADSTTSSVDEPGTLKVKVSDGYFKTNELRLTFLKCESSSALMRLRVPSWSGALTVITSH